MAHAFSRNVALSKEGLLEQRYNNTRWNLLLVAIVTLINVIFVAGDSYFLFSATLPYTISYLAALFCGVFPPEYYGDEYALWEFWPKEVFYVAIAVSVLIIGLYVLAYFMSGKSRVGWLIFALIFFGVDTLFLLGFYGIALDMILDYAFHAWIIVILSMGVKAHFDLKKLPEQPVSEVLPTEASELEGEDSRSLGMADMEVKCRVFLEAEANGCAITYRRVKKTNQLVINGQLYDEYEALVEQGHVLSATIGGHLYEAGITPAGVMFIDVDGQRLAKKLRIF
ncbi:MAG: hypothetical protein IJY66_02925 [Clostridia bacterium]|nr:hypothetical protein [Clostridia bacterium]